MADDGGVLGNLPNSRPGKRSAKRASGGRPAKTAGKAAAKAEAGGKPAARAPRTSKSRTTAKPGRAAAGAGARPKGGAAAAGRSGGAASARERADRQQPQPSADAMTTVVRTAAAVAVTGVRVAGAVTQEILRRLPRP